VLDLVHREPPSFGRRSFRSASVKELLLPAIRLFAVLTLLTGIVYPLLVTGVGRLLFPLQAHGSLVNRDGAPRGSALLAQKFTDARYFWPRPSAADFATVPSGASNLGPGSKLLQTAIAERRSKLGARAPDDLLTSSGSGLDPHLSPEAAMFEADRVAAARGIPVAQIRSLIVANTEPPQFGLLGEPRVNVLRLNLALDHANGSSSLIGYVSVPK